MTVTIDLAPCETIILTESHDMGGDGNRGTNVKITYQNSAGQPIHDETMFGFNTGTYNFPASVPWPYPWRGARASNVLPYSIKVESVSVYGQGNPPSPPSYSFSYTKAPRPGYNVGGDSFANAPLVAEQPTAYPGSVYQNWSSSSNPQADPGQYFKVHLKCNQAIDVYGSATGSTQYGASFRIHLYDAAQNPVLQPWVFLAAYGQVNYTSSSFTNPNPAESDFYILVTSDSSPVYDFTLNIEYVPSNSSPSPRSVAPDATGGSTPNSEEYHFTPPLLDRNDVLTGRDTELWAKMYWPSDFSGGPYPLVVFLHGNHLTCGVTGTSPRVDDDNAYTYFGTCGVSRFFAGGNPGTARNDSAGWFGMKITTGTNPLVVKSLGRLFLTGNTGTHTIKIVRASDNVQIGSASLSLSTGTNNYMRYQDLSSPVSLAANTAYYIVSQEFVGGDQWYDSDATITSTGVATVNGSASSSDGATWTVGSTPGHSYGLVDFVYDSATGRSVVQNQLGYEYLATEYLAPQLASRGYIVASINANRGITGANDSEYVDDPKYIFARGRLVLKHLETLSKWNSGPTGLITVAAFGTSRKNATGWFGMQITVGPNRLPFIR